jgi:hypothetical protein
MPVRFALALLAALLLVGFQPESERLLWSSQWKDAAQGIRTHHAAIALIQQSSTEADHGLRVDFEHAAKPQIEFSMAGGNTDWRPFGALAADISNPSNEPVGFSVEVEDADGAVTTARTLWDLGAGGAGRFAVAINSPRPTEMGMRGGPLLPGARLMAGDHRTIDIEHVKTVRIFVVNPPGPRSLTISNLRLVPGVTYDKIVDAYGQFALTDWPGKLKDGSEFQKRLAEEDAQLNARPSLPDRDEYGGWASGPQLEATGYFRTERRDGAWWLVTPSGHLFFSLGMNSAGAAEGNTVVQGREHMFQWLPAPDDPLATNYGSSEQSAPLGLTIKFVRGRTFRFYTANLARKYGADWLKRWRANALARLRAWGFNTIGNWSDPELYEQDQIPYTVTLSVQGAIARIPSSTAYWGQMLDPFDPLFREAVDTSVRRDAGCIHSRWCIGYFVDNELSWGTETDERSRYSLALGTLTLSAGSPAKQTFVEQLRKRYQSITAFNDAWHSHFNDWSDVLASPHRPQGDFTNEMSEDMRMFLRALARQYFQTIREALRSYDPNHLYLGSRFAWYTAESVEACAEFCDIVSFNIYEPMIEQPKWQFLDRLGKPAIIGEFHMGATDRGMFHPGLVRTPDQSARAATFTRYVRSVVDNPALVGCHYFQYIDEPLTGRSVDGENYSIGFATVVDGVYPEMVAAAKTVGAEMYRRRSKQFEGTLNKQQK